MSEAGPLPEREPITVELDRNMQLNVMDACFNRYFGNDWAESEDAQKGSAQTWRVSPHSKHSLTRNQIGQARYYHGREKCLNTITQG